MALGMSMEMGALMLLVWTSVEMVSGQKPCSARRLETSQEKEPLPWPATRLLPKKGRLPRHPRRDGTPTEYRG